MDFKKTVLDSKNALHLGETEVADQGHFKQRNRVAMCVYYFQFFYFFEIGAISIECQKIKTNFLTLTNHNYTVDPVNQSKAMQIHVADRKCGKKRTSESRLVVVLLSSDWIKKWREFFKPIAWSSNARPK